MTRLRSGVHSVCPVMEAQALDLALIVFDHTEGAERAYSDVLDRAQGAAWTREVALVKDVIATTGIAGTANLPPEKNRNYEVGSTWNLNRGRLSLRTALFRTDKLNAREPDPQNTLLNVLAGTQRVNGAQLEVKGRLLNRWEILASYAYLDAHVIASAYYPAAVGARLANVPANTFNIWNDVRLPGNWRAGIGGNYVSSRTASSTAPLDPVTELVKELPGYWVFNAMASHRLIEHADLQANVYNLANRYYYDQLHPGHIVLGPGRSALIGIKFKF